MLALEPLAPRVCFSVAPFTPDQIIAKDLPRGTTVLDFADMDGDGDRDLIVAESELSGRGLPPPTSSIVWYENADGIFEGPPNSIVEMVESRIHDIIPFRWNLESNAVPNTKSNEPVSLLVTSDGTHLLQRNDQDDWQMELLSEATTAVPVDFDLDGDLDFVVGTTTASDPESSFSSRAWSWLENDGFNQFIERIPTINNPPGGFVSHVAVGDIDGDDDLDVAVGTALINSTAWYENLGSSSSFSEAKILTHRQLFTSVTGLELADIDGDNNLDLLSITSGDHGEVAWLLNQGDGVFKSEIVWFGGGPLTNAMDLADLDADGDLEVITTTWRGVQFYEGVADGFATNTVTIDDSAHAFAIDDIDGDADMDVVIVRSGELVLLRNELEKVQRGDVNRDLKIDARDVDALHAAITANINESRFDLDGSGKIDANDLDQLVGSILDTTLGDTNIDGVVDFADASVLAENFGSTGSWSDGDFTLDGKVDFADFLLLSANWRL